MSPAEGTAPSGSPRAGVRNKARGAGVEDYILNNASKHAFKVSVFTGPIFDDTDDVYRAVKLRRIEELTGLSFGALVDADALERVEATTDVIDLESFERIVW